MAPKGSRVLLAFTIAATACAAIAAFAGSSNEQFEKDLGDDCLVGDRHSDDVPAGFAEAKRTGKPLMLVRRCVP